MVRKNENIFIYFLRGCHISQDLIGAPQEGVIFRYHSVAEIILCYYARQNGCLVHVFFNLQVKEKVTKCIVHHR
jgi:hypothetical protein